MERSVRILIIEDNEDDYLLMVKALERHGLNPDTKRVETEDKFLAALKSEHVECILADFTLPSFSGIDALRLLKEHDDDIPFIIVSGPISDEMAVSAMKSGVHDYVLKDSLIRLGPAVERELRDAQVRKDRKKAELASLESEKKYRAIFNNAQVGIFLSNAATGKLIEANQKLCDILRYPDVQTMLDTLVTKHLYVEPSERERLFDELDKNGEVSNFETQMYRYDGDIFWARFDIKVNAKKGTFDGFAIDVTENKIWHSEIERKNRELESALRVKAEFLSMVSHELRTPLVPIVGYIDLLLDGSLGNLPDEAVKPVNVIKKRAEDLTKLIDDLLVVSRIDQSGLQLRIEPIMAKSHINEIIIDFKALGLPKDVKITVEGDDLEILADHRRFQQVIRNLLDNAVKYSNDSVEINILLKTDGNLGLIEVSDNGIGISDEFHEEIFKQFFQVESIETRERGGAGLGLAICKEFIVRMDGTLTVESEFGKGTKFTLSLPLK